MTPAEPLARPETAAPSQAEPGAAFACRVATLKKRRDFLACANRGRSLGLPGLRLQARRRGPEEPAETPMRVGYTCSKKVGNAVARNRAKRRLRAAAREVLPRAGRPGWDYVLIGLREATAQRPFADLAADLETGLAKLHARQDRGEPERRRPPRRGKGRK